MNPTAVPPIRLGALTKLFGRHAVLRGVDLTVHPGELLGLVGPNGAGKSTLLRTLIGLVQRTDGTCAVHGIDPDRDALGIRRRTCYLPGETGVYQQMTGAQFLDFALSFYPRRDEVLQTQLGAEFALPLAARVRSYSAGMKQKLALWATLVPDVDLYVLDEPDRALDARVRFFLRDVLLHKKRQGRTIVLSSHHLSEVETLADRLEFLIDGRLVPGAVLAEARERLRRQPRVRFHGEPLLPAGGRVVRTEPDGTCVVETADDPFAWLQQVPPERLQSAEVGVVRLEDLYQLLLQTGAEVAP